MRKIFDKKFVHCMWDDVLEGKRCIVSDSIDIMIDAINNGAYHTAVINRSKGGGYTLHSNETGSDYVVAYYDPNYEVKLAYVQGKQIQFRNKGTNWIDTSSPSWKDDCEYRVKPEKTWRPFENIQELKQVWNTKLMGRTDIISDCSLMEPFIWVRVKAGQGMTRLIRDYDYEENMVCVGPWRSLEQLFDVYEFLDGSPCGVEE